MKIRQMTISNLWRGQREHACVEWQLSSLLQLARLLLQGLQCQGHNDDVKSLLGRASRHTSTSAKPNGVVVDH